MKIIQSFWTQNKTSDVLDTNFGWLSGQYNWLSWILSVNQLSKFYNVELYTDEVGYEILIKKLKLPYQKVHVTLDQLNKYHSDLWAMPKVKVYKEQRESFLHVDGDVFIWDKFSDDLTGSELITQNLERTTGYYFEMWKEIYPLLKFIPKEMNDYIQNHDNYAYNMGIIGGNDINFFQEYSNQAIEFVDKNSEVWEKINGFNFNIFFEQVLFYQFAKTKQKKVSTLFSEISDDNNYVGFADFDRVPTQKTYLHLLGNYKKSIKVCKNLEAYVLDKYPEYFERLRNILPVKFSFYNIDFKKNKIDEMKKNYLKDFKNIGNLNEFVIARNIYSLELPKLFDSLIESSKDFKLVVLPKTSLEDFITQNEVVLKKLTVEDFEFSPFLILDNIDEIILDELNTSILWSKFKLIMFDYLDSDIDSTGKEDFMNLLISRIRFFIAEKVLLIEEMN
jgi:hypothetical protein